MPIVLTVTAGPHTGRTFSFDRHDTFLVGRAPEAHFCLPDDPYFSRLHFVVEINPPLCRITDLGGRNGTQVNGVRIQSINLTHGDEIRGGKTALRVSVPSAVGAQAAPAHTLDLPASVSRLAVGHEQQLSAIIRDYQERKRRGEQPQPADYELQHPSLAPAIRLALMPDQTRTNTSDHRFPDGAQVPAPWPTLPGYQVTQVLGEGGMGVVYRAVREVDGLSFAIKTIRPAVRSDAVTTGRFLREASILRQLCHPGIVGYLTSGEVDGLLYFVMEFVEGTDAGQLVARQGQLEIRRAVRLTIQMLDCLQHAHDRGFVHRDIKPSNVLLTGTGEDERVKLADFGLARTYLASPLSGLTLSGVSAGTPRFMPPEQVTNFHSVRPAGDQYSAACTLYHLLTGAFPFEGNTFDLFRKLLNEPPIALRALRPDVPEGLAQAIHRGLARRPEDRFADARTFARVLDTFVTA